ncbi:MAG TPA: hypothetical protein VFF65_06430, partial [Phycisphaerales bacterium]|nr:hypothetical protein [Phycisphaerales bacterium]
MPPQPAHSHAPAPAGENDPELGPLLFERSRPSHLYMTLSVAMGATGAVAVGVAVNNTLSLSPNSVPVPVAWAAAGVLLAGTVACAIMAYRRKMILRFHQSGVARRPLGDGGPVERVPYHAITGIALQTVRHHSHGIYSHTALTLVIRSDPALRLSDFKYSGRLKEKRKGFLKLSAESTDELEPIHAAVSERLATLMLDRVRAGEVVAWTEKLALSADGLHAKDQLYPFAEIKEATVVEGSMKVVAKGKFFAAATAATGEMNFLAGWMVFSTL